MSRTGRRGGRRGPGVGPRPLAGLRDATRARVALGRTGDSLGIAETLALRLAHAAARDAVHVPVDMAALAAALGERPHVVVHSAAPDRDTYLQRPDLGRRLDDAGRAALEALGTGFDLVVVIADGLSSRAVQEHAVPLLDALTARLDGSWSVGAGGARGAEHGWHWATRSARCSGPSWCSC